MLCIIKKEEDVVKSEDRKVFILAKYLPTVARNRHGKTTESYIPKSISVINSIKMYINIYTEQICNNAYRYENVVAEGLKPCCVTQTKVYTITLRAQLYKSTVQVFVIFLKA